LPSETSPHLVQQSEQDLLVLSEIVRVCHKPPPFFFSLSAMIVNKHVPDGKRRDAAVVRDVETELES
jgi:hypothetical protein